MVVPPFEATGLNDDIWAEVHRDMVEVAEVLNSMGGKNKCDNSMDKNKIKGDNGIDKNKNHVEHPVPLQGTTARRQCSAGR